MTSLRDMQTAVLEALLEDRLGDAAPYLAPPEPHVGGRLTIHRSNILTNFSNALRSTFPVVERLVGADYFRQIAADFQRKHPSRSGDLAQVGMEFPNYLLNLHRADRFRYLSDVARLEWLIQQSSLAAHHAPFALDRLAHVEPKDYEELRFALHPSVRCFTSPFPALAIWQSNNADRDARAMTPAGDAPHAVPPGGAIALDSGPDRLVMLRPRLHLEFLRVSAGELAFLGAIAAAAPFAATIECGRGADAEFDASAALRRFITAEAIVDVEARP